MRKFIGQIFKLGMVLGICLLFLVMSVGYMGYTDKIDEIPLEEKVISIQQDEDYVTIDKINKQFLDAIVATEDKRFYNHGAIDPISLTRAVLTNLKEGKWVEGGSTITQQLAKNMYFTRDKKLMRKVEELFMASHIEREYSKDEILELYVNVIYYGDGYTGIKEASEGYFNKSPEELSFDEATLLAGLPQAPSKYALSSNYEAAKRRQSKVIACLNDYKG
nr:biosynthetic peptidoglycan transglycosylase [uncultured Niameybacter sp.]